MGDSMNTRQLEYIVTVANEKSISAAADKLLVSQPSLSQYIKRLEEELGIELFERTIPLKLTLAGETYIKIAKEILKNEDELNKRIEDIKDGSKGTLRIGTGFFNSVMVMPYILNQYKRKYPNVNIELYEDVEGRLFSEDYPIDLDVIVSSIELADDNYVREHLADDRYILAIPKKMMTGGKNLDQINLDAIPFITLGKETQIQQVLDDLFASFNTKLNEIMHCTNGMVAYRMAKSGIGACLVPSSIIKVDFSENEEYFDYHEINMLNNNRLISAYYKKNKYLTKMAIEFIKILKEYYLSL